MSIQLFQTRTFSSFFSDTFTFLKQNGKHFFKHYFIIIGPFLLAFVALVFAGFHFMGDFLGVSGVYTGDTAFESFINENPEAFTVLAIAAFLIIMAVMLMNYTYTPLYLKLYEKKGIDFGTSDITAAYKKHLGKIAVFFLVCILLAIPTGIAVAIPYVIAAFTIVGSYWVLAIVMFVYNGGFLEYINTEKSPFSSIGYSLSLLFGQKFWHASGAMWLFYLLGSLFIYAPVIVLYIYGISTIVLYEPGVDTQPEGNYSFLTILLIAYALIFLLGAVINSLIQINQGIVYYSLKEEKENIHTKSAIDQIGETEE